MYFTIINMTSLFPSTVFNEQSANVTYYLYTFLSGIISYGKSIVNSLVLQTGTSGLTSTIEQSVPPGFAQTFTIPDVATQTAGAITTNLLTGLDNQVIADITQDTTLPADATTSGNLYILTTAAANRTITMPNVVGTRYRFVVGATLTHTWTIAGPTSTLYGKIVSADGTAVVGGVISGKTSITLGTTAAIGDYYEFVLLGTGVSILVVNGFTGVHGSVTVNA